VEVRNIGRKDLKKLDEMFMMNLPLAMKSKPTFDRYQPFLIEGDPVGRRPDGQWIFSVEELPLLPIPQHAVVAHQFIEFDGWVFPLAYTSKSLLIWLINSFLRWQKEDDSFRNREWVQGIKEAFEDACAGIL
jgi:hypothetical protein